MHNIVEYVTHKHKSIVYTDTVMNLVCGLLSDCHKRSPLHHIDSHTTHHTGVHFPSSIALMTHAQLIVHAQLNALIKAVSHAHLRALHTLHKTLSDPDLVAEHCLTLS